MTRADLELILEKYADALYYITFVKYYMQVYYGRKPMTTFSNILQSHIVNVNSLASELRSAGRHDTAESVFVLSFQITVLVKTILDKQSLLKNTTLLLTETWIKKFTLANVSSTAGHLRGIILRNVTPGTDPVWPNVRTFDVKPLTAYHRLVVLEPTLRGLVSLLIHPRPRASS